jgi:hypothetical protein
MPIIDEMAAKHASKLLRLTRLNAVPAPYDPILQLQESLFQQRKAGEIDDTWVMLQVRAISCTQRDC